MRLFSAGSRSERGRRLATAILLFAITLPVGVMAQGDASLTMREARGLSLGKVADEGLSPDWALDRALDRETYLLGPGDRLLLILEGKSLRRIPLTVLPEGILNWQGGLNMSVVGLSLAEAQRRVGEELEPILASVDLSLLLLEPRLVIVHVLGEVARPGILRLRASDRIGTAVAAAGGPSRRGSRRFVEIKSVAAPRVLDLYPFQFDGDWDANPYLPVGQVIYVPLRTDTVRVVGEVNRPGGYEWRDGETLGDFLDYAGGLTIDAMPGSILLERDEVEVEIRMTAEIDRDLPLRPDDVLVVGSRKPVMKRVFIEGAGERRGEIYLSPGETLGDLVHRLGDTRGQALPEQAVLERVSQDRSEFIRIDLRELLQGRGPVTMPIENDDVLYVPVRSRVVFILGEVENPGPQAYNPSMTVGQYLALAGGTSSKGSNTSMKIIDLRGRSIDANSSLHMHRGDILLVRKSKLAVFSELLIAVATISSIILSINALAK